MFQQIVAKLLSEHEVMHELIVRLGRPERIHSVGIHQADVQTRHRVFVGRPLKRLAHLGSLFAMSRKMSRASSDGYVFLLLSLLMRFPPVLLRCVRLCAQSQLSPNHQEGSPLAISWHH